MSDGTLKAFDSVDVLFAAKDLLDPNAAQKRNGGWSWAYVAGVYDMVAQLLGVSSAEAEAMVEALGERR